MDYPNDKSTVFSIVPFIIDQLKPGIYPGHFKIDPCLDDRKPNRLSVGASEHLITVGGRKQPIRVTQPSFEIARSIVQDFLDSQLFSNSEAHPGICWLQGDISLEAFLKDHSDKYEQMKQLQRKWFVVIIQKTTDDWNKYRNSRVVSDQARFAVKALNIETPEWMQVEVIGLEHHKCPACSTANDSENAVCSNCRCVLNEKKFSTLKFAS